MRVVCTGLHKSTLLQKIRLKANGVPDTKHKHPGVEVGVHRLTKALNSKQEVWEGRGAGRDWKQYALRDLWLLHPWDFACPTRTPHKSQHFGNEEEEMSWIVKNWAPSSSGTLRTRKEPIIKQVKSPPTCGPLATRWGRGDARKEAAKVGTQLLVLPPCSSSPG